MIRCFVLVLLVLAASPLAAQRCESFRRADVDGDGRLQLNDGILTLDWLFRGGAAPRCPDASDADDSGSIDLSDAVYTFSFLFLGGPPPPAPWPDCGEDPTRDDLFCEPGSACGPVPAVEDRSEFERFRYRISPGLGFCPERGELLELQLQQSAKGILLERTVLVESDPGDPLGCEWPLNQEIFEGFCVTPTPVPARPLTAEEEATFLAIASELEVYLEPDPICECVVFDPCLVRSYAFDESSFSAFPCSSLRVTDRAARRLQEFIDGFRGLEE